MDISKRDNNVGVPDISRSYFSRGWGWITSHWKPIATVVSVAVLATVFKVVESKWGLGGRAFKKVKGVYNKFRKRKAPKQGKKQEDEFQKSEDPNKQIPQNKKTDKGDTSSGSTSQDIEKTVHVPKAGRVKLDGKWWYPADYTGIKKKTRIHNQEQYIEDSDQDDEQ